MVCFVGRKRYRDSWPSLFIGPPGTASALHIDSNATHFWMALFSGQTCTPCSALRFAPFRAVFEIDIAQFNFYLLIDCH
eukprot:COSAG02_NODE_51130_length_316_cov_0.705069_1_plen_78_part_01